MKERRYIPKGISFVECLVALCIGSFLIAASWQILGIGNRIAYNLNSALKEMQSDILLEGMLRDRIHHAGQTPCLPLDNLITRDAQDQPLESVQFTSSQITVNRIDHPVRVMQVVTPNEFLLEEPWDAQKQQRYLISDCYSAEQVEVMATQMNRVKLKQPLHYAYHPPIFLGEWLRETFKVSTDKGLIYQTQHADLLHEGIRAMVIRSIHNGQIFQIDLKKQSGKNMQLIIRRRMGFSE